MREVADAFAAEGVQALELVPLRVQFGQQHLEAGVQAAEFVVGEGARFGREQRRCLAAEAGPRGLGHGITQHRERARHRRDDPGREQGGQQHHGQHRPERGACQLPGQARGARRRQPRLARNEVEVTRHVRPGPDGDLAQAARGDHGIFGHVFGVVAHHVGGAAAAAAAGWRGADHAAGGRAGRRRRRRRWRRRRGSGRSLANGLDRHLEIGRQGLAACARTHGAVQPQQVELAVGLEEQQASQKRRKGLGVAPLLRRQVIVQRHDAAEKGVSARVGPFTLEALEGQRHCGQNAERSGHARDQQGEREAQANRHGRILGGEPCSACPPPCGFTPGHHASCSPRRAR